MSAIKIKIRPGQLDRIIRILSSDKAQNATGQLIEERVDDFKAWAYTEYKGGDEVTTSDQLAAHKKMNFVVRYNNNTKTIDETKRISHDGKIYQVKAIGELEDTRHRFFLITTELIE